MTILDVNQILERLPHRYPFLLVDRVTEIEVGKWIKCYKNVTYNEPFFTGHFPQKPVMPGVLIIEAMAQATGLLAYETVEEKPSKESIYYFVSADKVKFKQPVGPGDKLELYAELLRVKKGMWKFDCNASVDGKVVASGEIMCVSKDS